MKKITINNVIKRKRTKDKIGNTYISMDYYKNYIKVRPKESEYVLHITQFRFILKYVNDKMRNKIYENGVLHLPNGLGSIFLITNTYKPFIKDGKMEYKAPVNWGATTKLWAEDAESREAKILIRHNPGDIYVFKYSCLYNRLKKSNSNLRFYNLRPTRAWKKELSIKLNNKEIIPHFKMKKHKRTWVKNIQV